MIKRNTPANHQTLLRYTTTIPTPQEDLKLITAAQKGNLTARNELLTRHMPAIRTYAQKQYHNHQNPQHLELEDAIHVAILGTIHAINKFNPKKTKNRFIFYAKHWIRDYIHKAINEYRLYTIPLSTRYYYKTGRLNNPQIQQAINHFKDITYLSPKYDTPDHHLNPEQTAIHNEELQHLNQTP